MDHANIARCAKVRTTCLASSWSRKIDSETLVSCLPTLFSTTCCMWACTIWCASITGRVLQEWNHHALNPARRRRTTSSSKKAWKPNTWTPLRRRPLHHHDLLLNALLLCLCLDNLLSEPRQQEPVNQPIPCAFSSHRGKALSLTLLESWNNVLSLSHKRNFDVWV